MLENFCKEARKIQDKVRLLENFRKSLKIIRKSN